MLQRQADNIEQHEHEGWAGVRIGCDSCSNQDPDSHQNVRIGHRFEVGQHFFRILTQLEANLIVEPENIPVAWFFREVDIQLGQQSLGQLESFSIMVASRQALDLDFNDPCLVKRLSAL